MRAIERIVLAVGESGFWLVLFESTLRSKVNTVLVIDDESR